MSGNEDSGDFARLFPGVKRIEQDRVAPYRSRAPKTNWKPRNASERFEPAPFVEVPESWHRGGLQRAALRRFRRGEIRPGARLDLHGYPRDRAQRILESFIDRACQHGERCVLVIHGKGTRSEQRQAVLRQMTRSVLMRHDRVIAYAPARPRDGGTGAVYVYLGAGA